MFGFRLHGIKIPMTLRPSEHRTAEHGFLERNNTIIVSGRSEAGRNRNYNIFYEPVSSGQLSWEPSLACL